MKNKNNILLSLNNHLANIYKKNLDMIKEIVIEKIFNQNKKKKKKIHLEETLFKIILEFLFDYFLNYIRDYFINL